MTENSCPIWGTPAIFEGHHGEARNEMWDSPRAGGEFALTEEAAESVQRLKTDDKVKLTNWIVDQNRLGNKTVLIWANDIERVGSDRDLTVMERRDRLIMYLGHSVTRIGDSVPIGGTASEAYEIAQLELRAWTGSIEPSEFYYLINSCVDSGLAEKPDSLGSKIRLTTRGYEHLQNIETVQVRSEQAFVAMWFDKSTEGSYDNGFHRAISEMGYRPMRIDRKEHINKIDDEIIAEIRRSRFLVADFTSEPEKPRGGVYFEAGFAYGLNIPVIWTCQENLIAQVHFDTRQFNHIVWSNPDDLCTRLRNRIGAVIGDGPLKSAVRKR